MVKKRSFWTGMGLGIALGAILLQMMTIGATGLAAPESEQEDIHVDLLGEHAERLGYQLYANDQEWIAKDELERQVAAAERAVLKSVTPQEIVSVKGSFYILSGMSPEQVAEMLLSLSLIQDKELFINEMKNRNLQGQIQTGVYTFKDDIHLDEIVDMITTIR